MKAGFHALPAVARRSFQFQRAVLPTVAHRSLSSYYEVIDGLKHDRSALDAARAAVAGKGDGRVSVADAEQIFEKLADGNTITEVEYRTGFRILADFEFTDAGRTRFIKLFASH